MIGTVVRSRKHPGYLTLFAFGVALQAAPAAWYLKSTTLAMWAVFPTMLGVAGLLRHPWRFQMRLTDEAILVGRSKIPYDAIEAVVFPYGLENRSEFPIAVAHTQGEFTVPARVDVSSGVLREFLELRRRVVPFEVPKELAVFLAQQIELFGADAVWSCRGRTHRGRIDRYSSLVTWFWGICLTGFAWGVIGGIRPKLSGWSPPGIALGVVMGLIGLVVQYGIGANIKKWRHQRYRAGLVISPPGIAMIQGDLTGELRWDQIRAIRFPASAKSQHALGGGPKDGYSGAAVLLEVEGADIRIYDIYNQPLDAIYEQLNRYYVIP